MDPKHFADGLEEYPGQDEYEQHAADRRADDDERIDQHSHERGNE